MMFLLRTTFWLSVVLLVLPISTSQPKNEEPQISTIQAVSAAGAAVSDMGNFCSRQADACAVGSQVLVHLGHKAQAGAKMLYEFFTEKMDSTASVKHGVTTTGSVPSQNTLTQKDLAPAWRGPAPQKEASAKGRI
jgi:Family of unknown function (DUF5330)